MPKKSQVLEPPDHVVVDETRNIDVRGNTIKFRRDEIVRDPTRIALIKDYGIKTRPSACPECGHALE